MPDSLAQPSTSSFVWFPWTRQVLVNSWHQFLRVADLIGTAVQYTGHMIVFLVKGQLSWKHLIQQAAFVGIDTLGIALVLTTFSGMVIALQVAQPMESQGAGSYVGALVSMAILRELGPLMTGFSVIAMAGSAYAAELATMQITNQVDALRVLHIDPVRYLLLPRILAGVCVLPVMTVLTCTAGVLGGLLMTLLFTDLAIADYLDSVWQQTALKDVGVALLKGSIFGYLIFMISTIVGINTRGGAREIGLSTTRAVVWSFLVMVVVDYWLTYAIYGWR